MRLALVLTTLVLVIPAELPDKTFISCVVLAAKNKPFPVWVGAALALTCQALLGVVAGGLLALLPHRDVQIVVAVLFMAGAAYLILSKEKEEEDKGEKLAGKGVELVSGWRVFLTTFGIVALAEFGDITQILIANLAAKYKDPVSVFVGATGGFVIVSAFGVVAGTTITRFVPLGVVRRISGVTLLGFGIFTIVSLVR
ncbi:MAG: TMEM165/GDT1 family protein [Acidimicrobiales bacterium]